MANPPPFSRYEFLIAWRYLRDDPAEHPGVNAAELDRAEDTLFVKPGDSLWKLAKKHDVQGGWQALYEANQDIIDDPSLIYIGQELVLPTA